jgi:hypothetical protein
VVLESDVAAVFDSREKVNARLRSAISARKVESRRHGRALASEGQTSDHAEPPLVGQMKKGVADK